MRPTTCVANWSFGTGVPHLRCAAMPVIMLAVRQAPLRMSGLIRSILGLAEALELGREPQNTPAAVHNIYSAKMAMDLKSTLPGPT